MKASLMYVVVFGVAYFVVGGGYYLVDYRGRNSVTGLFYVDGWGKGNEVVVANGQLITDGYSGIVMMPFIWFDFAVTGKTYYYTDLTSVRSKKW